MLRRGGKVIFPLPFLTDHGYLNGVFRCSEVHSRRSRPCRSTSIVVVSVEPGSNPWCSAAGTKCRCAARDAGERMWRSSFPAFPRQTPRHRTVGRSVPRSPAAVSVEPDWTWAVAARALRWVFRVPGHFGIRRIKSSTGEINVVGSDFAGCRSDRMVRFEPVDIAQVRGAYLNGAFLWNR